MLITIILTLAGVGLGALLEDPLLYGLLGFLLGRSISLDLALDLVEQELARLRRVLAEDWERRRLSASSGADLTGKKESQEPGAVAQHRREENQAVVSEPSGEVPAGPSAQAPGKALGSGLREPSAARVPMPADPAPIRALLEQLRDWLQSGNLFVRVGILLLFLGVGFLIKYAVDRDLLVFTQEMRLAAVAAGAFFLLLLGWALRKRRREYALLLQGAAFGILYLDVYGAYQLYHLIPSTAAFALLFLTALAAALLAVVQDARALAWFGFAGGFLAPVVASDGSGAHLVLFSYYALLNAALLAVAWFKSWRALNLLGFAFTYVVAGVWGVFRYEPAHFSTTQPFLVLFFLLYLAITVLYALRQPPRFRGYLDATLLFGTPIFTFVYQMELVRSFEFGAAWSAAAMGTFYMALALAINRSAAMGLKLLAQAFLALGLVFVSLAIPFALGADETAAAWALEGAGLVWIGVQHRRAGARGFGLLLQAGAAAFLITDLPAVSTEDPFLNGFYLGAAVIGAAGAFSAYWLDRDHTDKRAWERGGAPLLLLWGLFWWFGSGLYELERFYPDIRLPAGILIYATLSLLLMEAVASLRPWRPIHRVQTGLPLAGVLALAVSLGVVDHPAEHGGTWAWPVFFAVVWLLLYRIERRDKHPSLSWGHAAGAVLLAAVLEWETTWRLVEQAGWIQGWRAAAFALVPVILLQGVIRSRIWPLEQWRTAYALIFGSVLATGIALWAILSIGSPGGSDPLPWFPLLNPLDTMLALGVLSMFQWWISLKTRLEVRFHRDQERLVWVFLGTLAFLWLNLVLLRAMHHWWGIDYAPGAMLRSNEVQMAMSILWGLTGVGLLLAARALASRGIWISGAAILAAVVVKLFLVDLAASATLERIVSFLAVGILLVGIGWFSPLPPRSEERGVAKNTETVRRKRSAA